MRCDEKSLKTVIELIDAKLQQDNYEEGINFRNAMNNLGNLNINEEFENNFWPSLSSKLANLIPKLNVHNSIKKNDDKTSQITEAKLLQAISHEVRTPLATIRTLISSTLKKYNMDESMKNRLIQIDNECNEQIDRFGLIFNAAELVSNEIFLSNQLARINLGEILHKLSPIGLNNYIDVGSH